MSKTFSGKLVPQDPNDQPRGWVRTNIDNTCNILDSKRIPVNSQERQKRVGNIPYYGATGQVGWINDHIFNEELVLLGEDGAPFFDDFKNKAYIIDGKSWVNNHAHVLKSIAGLMSNKFLLYSLNQIDYHEYVRGTTRLKLNQTSMKAIQILLPPLSEQKRIVQKIESILSQIDAAQSRLEVLASQVKSPPGSLSMLKNSVLEQAFEEKCNFETTEMGNLILFSKNGFTGRPNKDKKGNPRLGIESITNSNSIFINEDKCKFIDISKSKEKNYETKKGDLFFCRQNGNKNNVGKCKVLRNTIKSMIFSDSLIQFRLNDKIVPEYVVYFTAITSSRNQIEQCCFTTAGNFSINGTNLKKVLVKFPAVSQQKRIVSKIESILGRIDAIEKQVDDSLIKLDQLKKAVLKKAFEGKLVPQDPNDEPASILLEKIKQEKHSRVKKRK